MPSETGSLFDLGFHPNTFDCRAQEQNHRQIQIQCLFFPTDCLHVHCTDVHRRDTGQLPREKCRDSEHYSRENPSREMPAGTIDIDRSVTNGQLIADRVYTI